MKLPDFLIKAIDGNTTSLGTHPALPPEEEDTFIGSLLRKEYDAVMTKFNDENLPIKEVGKRLKELVTECQKIEENSIEALEKLCSDICTQLFDIPEDTINFETKLVGECDMSKYRMLPQPTPDFSFEDIDEMNMLIDEVYKRRMINVLIAGAAMRYAMGIDSYLKEIYDINPQLIHLYIQIIKYNMIILYNQPDTINNIKNNNSGKVDVLVGDEGERITIKAEGIIFPVLLEFAIKGLLETASQRGLPEDMDQAQYIIDKADYRLAENWDMRLGLPLWQIISSLFEENGVDVDEIGCNFIIMELSQLPPAQFNKYLQNIFKKTNLGREIVKRLTTKIVYNKERDDFDNFIQVQNDKYAINDNTEYTPEELLKEVENM